MWLFMQQTSACPQVFVLGAGLSYWDIGKAWLITLVGLLLLRDFTGSWTLRTALAMVGHVAVGAAAVMIAGLCLALLTKPLLIRLDESAGTLAYIHFGLPWKRTLNLQRVQSKLSGQQSHSGVRHYLLLYQDGKQVLSIGESIWWPYSVLEQVHQRLGTAAR